MKPMQMNYTQVGTHRGKPRLWLEGLRLADAGFAPGQRYTVVLDLERRVVSLMPVPQGERAVSSRTRANGRVTPIIDLADGSLLDVLGDGVTRVCVAIYPGRIAFSLHPVDAAVRRREARLRDNLRAGKLTEGVLCAGGGVSALAVKDGIERAGLMAQLDWVVDRDDRYLQVALDNNVAVATARIFAASLEELAPSALTPVDVVQVSLPCTGHSLSGKAKRGLAKAEDHPTDALAVYGALKLLEATQPAVVISENVKQAADSATYALVRAYLVAQGYVVSERVLNDHDAGSVEARERWWLVAVSRGLAEGFGLDNLPARERTYATLGEAMEPVAVDDPSWAHNTYLSDKAVRDKAAGKGFSRQFVGPDSRSVGCIGRGYAKRRSTEPFVRREDGMERLLTPVEHARVKGVPEELVEGVSAVVAHEILGQSILFGHASVLAEHIATHLMRVLALDSSVVARKAA